MQEAFDRLLRNSSLVTVALAIALGWALYQVAQGAGLLVSALLTEYDGPYGGGEPLTWQVGGRILTFGALLRGVIELGVVLLVALAVVRRRPVSSPR